MNEKYHQAIERLIWLIEVEHKIDGGHIVEDAKKLLPSLVIRSTYHTDEESGDPLYWNNEEGWVDHDEATKFSQEEADNYSLPQTGYWV